MTRRALFWTTVGALIALAVVVSLVPIGSVLGAVLFGVVVLLAGVLFFRFHPAGDTWDTAAQLTMNPWVLVAGMLLIAVAIAAWRLSIMWSA